MYTDPAKVRAHVVKIRLSDEEHELIQALVNYTGEQKATLLRDLVLEQAQSVLFGSKFSVVDQAAEVPYLGLLRAG